jgi:prepilin-type N-terminal cleavage/methylation domain-containing protein
MKMSSRSPRAAFTLLELVVVLAILAIVTALAVRALDGVGDQSRFEASRRIMEDLSAAVIGSPDDRTPDGFRTVSGFVADMGRLPRAVAIETAGTEEFTLSELWSLPGFPYDVRPADTLHGVPAFDSDPEVVIPGGWRGPYLRLASGARNPLDAWGNPFTVLASSTGYARLRNANDIAITAAAQEIGIIRHLGANGIFDANDTGYDRDDEILLHAQSRAAITGVVVITDSEGAPLSGSELGAQFITIRVFSPDPDDPRKIVALRKRFPTQDPENPLIFRNPIPYGIAIGEGLTIGPRVVRAYLDSMDNAPVTPLGKKSAAKRVTLRSGPNLLDITIEQ